MGPKPMHCCLTDWLWTLGLSALAPGQHPCLPILGKDRTGHLVISCLHSQGKSGVRIRVVLDS